jgi:hypothetical protein
MKADNYVFKINKYTKWYFNIINHAKNCTLSDSSYYEIHHIIPKSLNGSNRRTNLVKLTAREHFIVHLLLIKMVEIKDVYKMVHAIIRFTLKVSSSRQYELLRIFVSKYSTGQYNTSFGKIWIHHYETKNILYVKEDDFKIMDKSIFIKGLPYQRGGNLSGSKWITNGTEETICNNEDDLTYYLTRGWCLGRLFQPSNKQMKLMTTARHTKERDKEHSHKLKNCIQLYNPSTKQVKRIKKNQVNKFLLQGFIIKSIPTSLSKQCIINNINYDTLNDAARNLGISTSVLSYRIKSKHERWNMWKYLPK